MGKIHLLKVYALSKLNYVSSLIVVPQWICVEVDFFFLNFCGWKRSCKAENNVSRLWVWGGGG